MIFIIILMKSIKKKQKKIKDSVEYLNKEKLEDEKEQKDEKDNIENENINDDLTF